MKGFKFQISNYFDCYIGNNFQDDKGYHITLGRACKQIAKLHCQDPWCSKLIQIKTRAQKGKASTKDTVHKDDNNI